MFFLTFPYKLFLTFLSWFTSIIFGLIILKSIDTSNILPIIIKESNNIDSIAYPGLVITTTVEGGNVIFIPYSTLPSYIY